MMTRQQSPSGSGDAVERTKKLLLISSMISFLLTLGWFIVAAAIDTVPLWPVLILALVSLYLIAITMVAFGKARWKQ